MYIDYFDSPLGLIEFTSTKEGIAHVIFCGEQTEIKVKSLKSFSVGNHEVNRIHPEFVLEELL